MMVKVATAVFTGIGTFAIGLGVVLLVMGFMIWGIGDSFRESAYEIPIEAPQKTGIDFEDHEPLKTWMSNAEIRSGENEQLVEGTSILLKAFVESPNPPKELVVHIFHEDVTEFFTNEDDPSGFRHITKELNRIPMLTYGTIGHIDFDMKKYWKCIENNQKNKGECSSLPQNEGKIEFSESGKYFVQFSAKLDENVFEHRKSPRALTTILDLNDIWLEEQVASIKFGALVQSAESKYGIATAFFGIGAGMIFSGLALIRPVFEKT